MDSRYNVVLVLKRVAAVRGFDAAIRNLLVMPPGGQAEAKEEYKAAAKKLLHIVLDREPSDGEVALVTT